METVLCCASLFGLWITTLRPRAWHCGRCHVGVLEPDAFLMSGAGEHTHCFVSILFDGYHCSDL